MPTLDQAAMPLDLSWTQGNPVHFNQVFVGKAATWTGLASIVSPHTPALEAMLATLTPTGADSILDLSLTAVQSALLPTGKYDWSLRRADGLDLAAGRVFVLDGARLQEASVVNLTLITPQDVFDWMNTPPNSITAERTALMQKVINAVIVRISRGWDAPDDFDDDWQLAHIMQCARIWKRKDSPEGIIANDQFGTVRVTRIDSDIADMLVDFSKGPWPVST